MLAGSSSLEEGPNVGGEDAQEVPPGRYGHAEIMKRPVGGREWVIHVDKIAVMRSETKGGISTHLRGAL